MKPLDADIVIVGGGSSGVAAAIAAATSGCKILLIEQLSYLGGKATAAEVGTICGLYKFKQDSLSEFIVKGFTEDFAVSLQKKSNTQSLHNNVGLHYLPYHIEDYKELCLELMKKFKISLLLNTEVIAVQKEGNSLTALKIKTESGETFIHFKTVIDCTGNSVISQQGGLPVISSDNYQTAAQIFSLKGLGDIAEATLGMALMRDIQKGIANSELEFYYDRISVVQGSIKNNLASFKLGIPIPVTYQANNLQELKDKAHEMINTLIKYLSAKSETFKNISLDHIAPEIGLRTGLRAEGKYTLTESDVLECKKFPTAIANCSWPIEEWGQDKRVKMRYFEMDNFYQIPADCLISKYCDNLFFAGHNISATDGAIASARVMGICFQTGYAAGKLASGKVTNTDTDLTIRQIQHEQIF